MIGLTEIQAGYLYEATTGTSDKTLMEYRLAKILKAVKDSKPKDLDKRNCLYGKIIRDKDEVILDPSKRY